LSAWAPGVERGEGLRRREIAGAGDQAGGGRRGDHLGVGVGRDDQPAAGGRTGGDLATLEHGAGADQRAVAEARASRSMLFSGSGELSGTSMIRMPASKSASPIASASSGRDAADDRDQRAFGEIACEADRVGSCQILLRMALMPGEESIVSPSTSIAAPGDTERRRRRAGQLGPAHDDRSRRPPAMSGRCAHRRRSAARW
jgi:hypothetical protein